MDGEEEHEHVDQQARAWAIVIIPTGPGEVRSSHPGLSLEEAILALRAVTVDLENEYRERTGKAPESIGQSEKEG